MNKTTTIDYKAFSHICIITAKISAVVLTSLIISLLAANLFIIISFFIGRSIKIESIIYTLTIFLTLFTGCLLIKPEYNLMLNRDLKFRPPFQFFLFLAVFWIIIYFTIPKDFTLLNRYSLPGYGIVSLMALLAAVIVRQFTYLAFSTLLKLITKLTNKRVLDEADFTKELAFRMEEAKRYARKFSLLLVAFTVPEEAKGKIRNRLIMPLFINIIRYKIRGTDILGMIMRGRTAAVISNNNDSDAAEIQAKRIIDALKSNKLLEKKLHVYLSEFKCGIASLQGEQQTPEEMLQSAKLALQDAIESKSLFIAKNTGKLV